MSVVKHQIVLKDRDGKLHEVPMGAFHVGRVISTELQARAKRIVLTVEVDDGSPGERLYEKLRDARRVVGLATAPWDICQKLAADVGFK